MDSFILRYILVKFIRVFDRAVLDADSAARALALINILGVFSQLDLKVSCFPNYAVNLSVS
ncbi:MAG: hypothetical protein A4E53_01228 [Pelotomaculum sp. PtaB.Bin104]|nr:MAG: hypothetical protein A4E53_01228 [Pelotomaculum sp. PtaB.Bin104]